MKKLALLCLVAAAAFLTPVLTPAPAEAQSVTLRVGDPGYNSNVRYRSTTRYRNNGYRSYGATRSKTVVRGPNCTQTTVRTVRANGTVYQRKVRRC